MLDRANMISMESAVADMKLGARFMPFFHAPARDDGSAPDRVVWAEFDDQPLREPFTDMDLHRQAAEVRWFVSELGHIEDLAVHDHPIPLRGVVMHMSRCGSTLARMLLGEVEGSFTLSEPGIVNSTLIGTPAPRLGPILRAVFTGKSGPFTCSYLKCTSWNVLEGEMLLNTLEGPPAIFLHRDPADVLVSLHLSRADWYHRLFLKGEVPDDPPDPTTGNARFLAGMLKSAFELEDAGRLRFVAYEDVLDRFIDGDLPEYLGYEVDDATRDRMLKVSKIDSKNTSRNFQSDTARKKRIADENPVIREAASELDELHAEACRRSAWNPRSRPA